MSDGNEVPEEPVGGEDSSSDATGTDEELEAAGRSFLKRISHIIFGEGILRASSDEEREDFAKKYAHSPNLDWEEVQEIIRYCDWADRERAGKGERPLLITYSKIFLNTVLRERTERAKSGISILTTFNGKIVGTIGQVLNEGVTEMSSSRMVRKMAKERPDLGEEFRLLADLPEDYTFGDGAYHLAVKAAEHLEALVGERTLMRAYFGDFESLLELAEEFDGQCGQGMFLELLSLTDKGLWKEAFTMLHRGKKER